MSILRLSHVEIRVPDLELATAYYSEVVGLLETAREPERVFMKCWDEHQHHSVVLTYAPTHGLNHFGFKVTDAADLDHYARRLAAGVPPSGVTRKANGAPATARRSASRCPAGMRWNSSTAWSRWGTCCRGRTRRRGRWGWSGWRRRASITSS